MCLLAGLAVVSFQIAAAPAQDRPPDAAIVRELTVGLANPDVDARRAAAKAVSETTKDVRAALLPRLRESLRTEKDGQVRLHVFESLTTMGADAAPAVVDLVFSMRTSFGGSRTEKLHQDYRAAIALASIGAPSVQALTDQLTSADTKENVRAEALMALGKIGNPAAAAIPAIVPFLGHESGRLRQEAIAAMGSIGDAAFPALKTAFETENVRIRAAAISAIGRSNPKVPSAVELVTASVQDPAIEVRVAAIESIGTTGIPDDRLITIYRTAIADKNPEAVRIAIKGLVSRPELVRSLQPELLRILAAGNPETASVAAFAVAKMGSDAVAPLLSALSAPTSPIEAIAEALLVLGRPASPKLAEALKAENPRVRQGAALALGKIRPLESETPGRLADGLKDTDKDVRGAFLKALGELGPRAGAVVPTLRGMLSDADPVIRVQAVKVLCQCAPKDDRLVADLAERLSDGDVQVRIASIDRLRSLGPIGRKALPGVTEILKGDDDAARNSAAAMIATHGPNAAESVPALIELLNDPKAETRLLAIRTLARIGRPAQAAFPKMKSLSKSTAPEEREAVFLAIGSLGLDLGIVKELLSEGLSDSEERVRKAAIGSVQQLGPAAVVLLPELIRVAANPQDMRAVERAVRRFERRSPAPETVPDLIALTLHEKEPVQLLAVRFLALVRPIRSDVDAALESLRNHSSETVRKRAAEAIDQIRAIQQ